VSSTIIIQEVWGFRENRTAVRFAYEWRDDSGHWFRSYGNENWEFDAEGLMRRRIASINDLPIAETDRKFPLAGGPPSGRPSPAQRARALAPWQDACLDREGRARSQR
jgi:nuclear transport factor 2 (NTF2) superfamily protein